jgi:ferredoxin
MPRSRRRSRDSPDRAAGRVEAEGGGVAHLITEKCVACRSCEIGCNREALLGPNAPTNLTGGTFATVGRKDFSTVPDHRFT